MKNLMELKKMIDASIIEFEPILLYTSKYIYDNPELSFVEIKASTMLSQVLQDNGFLVNLGVGDLNTAFTATFSYGKGKTNIGIIAEYDALPNLGHGCGHNLIAASALGAALCLKEVMENEGIDGKLTVIGTPAEENGGGKIILIEKGIFEDIDACIMMHPTSGISRIAGPCLSSHEIKINWYGKTAHAESHPEEGINALDAMHIFYTSIACLRQQLPSDVRIAQIVTGGGISEAMIPDNAGVSIDVVSKDKNLEEVVEKILKCAHGAAIATGCTFNVEHKTGYLGRVNNHVMDEIFRNNFEIIGELIQAGTPEDFGTTDFGNVTRIMPCCNPYVSLLTEEKISNHTQQFKELAISKRSEDVIRISSKVLAYSVLDLFMCEDTMTAAKKEVSYV